MIRDSVKVILAFVVGILIGVGLAWGALAARGTRVEILEGYTTNVDQAGIGIGVATSPDGPGRGYSVAGAFWREGDGAWHTSGPTCLEPLSSGQRVRLGVVQVKTTGEAPGREIVVWLECLD